jgi:hypothetical protein
MQINQTQLEQVNHQIERLVKADNFYGRKKKEAGITGVKTVEDFENLPFSAEAGAPRCVPPRTYGSPGERDCQNPFLFRHYRHPGHNPVYTPRTSMTGRRCSSAAMSLQASRPKTGYR